MRLLITTLISIISIKVLVEIDGKEYIEIAPVLDSAAAAKKRKKESPSPIALEPCVGNKAAVLSLLVQMPTGEFKAALPSTGCAGNITAEGC